MAYIQAGGRADGAAYAAPSPSRCALGRRSQAHARTDKQTGNRSKAQRARSRPADPLGAGFRFFLPRIAFFYDFCPLLFCAAIGHRAMSLSGVVRSLRGLPVRYIRPLSSIQSCQRGVFSCPLNHRGRRYPRP